MAFGGVCLLTGVAVLPLVASSHTPFVIELTAFASPVRGLGAFFSSALAAPVAVCSIFALPFAAESSV